MEGSEVVSLSDTLMSHNDKRKDWLRFIVAFTLILGFLFLIGIAMVGEYADPTILSGVFSGWIAAIIGFYFIEQGADRAQQQVIQSSEKSISVQKEKQKNIQATGIIQIDEIKNTIQTEYENKIKNLKEISLTEINKLEKLLSEKDAFIEELLDMLNKNKEGGE